MSSKNPTRIILTHDEIIAALVEGFKKKSPSVADEEFEITLSYDSYGHTISASTEVL